MHDVAAAVVAHAGGTAGVRERVAGHRLFPIGTIPSCLGADITTMARRCAACCAAPSGRTIVEEGGPP